MAEWRDIESAPKDGSTIIYAGKYEGPPWVSVGRWTDNGWYDINTDYFDGQQEYPTHWMPLPDPPKAGKEPTR